MRGGKIRSRLCTGLRLILWLCICALGSSADCRAETRRALLVGINAYKPSATTAPSQPQEKVVESKPNKGRGSWSDLDGCLNDVAAIKEIVIGRLGFKAENVRVLTDSQAKRESVLVSFQKQMIDEAAAGDVCFFFYAGHGSRIRNLKTDKPTGMDSTIVPADSCEGVIDIRDKELARLFNKALDKGVILTAVFDSCHSGSIARGLASPEKARYLEPDTRVVSDAPDPGKKPEERGALILSAAQDYQVASEARDEADAPHGAFTVAFLKALRSVPLNAPAEQLFQSAQVIMQAEKPQQVPVLAGTPERRQKPLLGVGTSTLSNRITIPVLQKETSRGEVVLRGGQAIGLNEGCELLRLPKADEEKNQPAVRIQVARVEGLARSVAKVVSGSIEKVQTGDLFEVDRWVYPPEASLKVWIPFSDLSYSDLDQLSSELATLRKSDRIQWVEDPTVDTPTHLLTREHSDWALSAVGNLGKEVKAEQVIAKLPSKSKLFVSLPPPKELIAELKLGEGTDHDSIQVVSMPAEAQYYLVGRWQNEKVEFAWLRPNSTQDDSKSNPLPTRTDWFNLIAQHDSVEKTARQLEDTAAHIGRLKGWLSLEARGGSGTFPYRLALKNTKSGAIKNFGETVIGGESYGLVLKASPNADVKQVEKRWVYVVSLDSWGKTQLVFPAVEQGNSLNRLPYDQVDANQKAYPAEIQLGDRNLFTVSEPFGIDTYILLTSLEPISDPSVFNSEGVRTRGKALSGLTGLFANTGAQTRGATAHVPSNWSIERVSIRSAPNAKNP
jgi:hypothetical protein